jgi:excisionase family DNA binding protein
MKFYTVPELAEILNVDPRTIRALIQKSELIAVRIGSEFRISEEDFTAFIEKNKTSGR